MIYQEAAACSCSGAFTRWHQQCSDGCRSGLRSQALPWKNNAQLPTWWMGNPAPGFICPNLFGRFAGFTESTFFRCFLYFAQEWINNRFFSTTENTNIIKSHQKFVFQHTVIFRFWIFLYICVCVYAHVRIHIYKPTSFTEKVLYIAVGGKCRFYAFLSLSLGELTEDISKIWLLPGWSSLLALGCNLELLLKT